MKNKLEENIRQSHKIKFCKKCGSEKYYIPTCKAWRCHKCRMEYQTNYRLKKRLLNPIKKKMQIKKTCKECGCEFFTRKKHQVFCSRRCSSINTFKLKKHIIRSEEAKIKGVIKRSKHPNTGKFITNCNAVHWSIISPRGVVYQFKNMNHFVRIHSLLFNENEIIWNSNGGCLAANQLRRLNPKYRSGITSWKGWKWYYGGNKNETK